PTLGDGRHKVATDEAVDDVKAADTEEECDEYAEQPQRLPAQLGAEQRLTDAYEAGPELSAEQTHGRSFLELLPGIPRPSIGFPAWSCVTSRRVRPAAKRVRPWRFSAGLTSPDMGRRAEKQGGRSPS